MVKVALQTLLTAVSALDTKAGLQNPNVREWIVLVEFGAGTTAGAVMLEASHDKDFTGTWSNVGTATWAAANSVKHMAVTGVFPAIRVRISTAIVGGTVTVRIMGVD